LKTIRSIPFFQHPAQLRPKTKRIPIIDFIRFVSILVVIGSHFYPRWVAENGSLPLIREFILSSSLNGGYGVTFFFVVSGFLITQMLAESTDDFSKIDLGTFYVKRAARIVPLLSIVILVSFLMAHVNLFSDEKMTPYHSGIYSAHFGTGFWATLLTFNFNWYLAWNDRVGVGMQWFVLWSLAVEEQFYFFYPVALKILKNRRRVLFFLGSVIMVGVLFRGISCLYFKASGDWMHWASFGAYDQLAVGGVLYFALKRFRGVLERRKDVSLFLFLLGAAACMALYFGTSIDDVREAILVPTLLAMGCAVVLLGGMHLPALNSAWGSFLSWPGKLSYGCYLWHPTLIFLTLPLLARMGGLRALGLLVLFVLGFSYISYKFFELPINHKIRSFFAIRSSQTL